MEDEDEAGPPADMNAQTASPGQLGKMTSAIQEQHVASQQSIKTNLQ